MMILAKRFFLVFIFSLISCSSPNNNSNELDIISLKGSTMGTSYNIKYSSEKKDSSEVEIVHKEIKKILKNINLEMSTYIPESEISKFNTSKSTEWFNISEDFFYVVKQSFKYNELSDGRYDITVQPLVNLWGFGPDKFLNPPTEAEIDSVKQFVGQNLIEINDGKLRKKDSRVQLDLSSIAKGFAVDKIFNYLENHDEVFVEIGGEIRTKSTIKDWKIGINTPSINNFSNDIEWDSSRVSGQSRRFFDISKSQNVLNFKQSFSLYEGLKDTYPYLDDVTVAGRTKEELDKNSRLFEEVCRKRNITLNESKTTKDTRVINILGY